MPSWSSATCRPARHWASSWTARPDPARRGRADHAGLRPLPQPAVLRVTRADVPIEMPPPPVELSEPRSGRPRARFSCTVTAAGRGRHRTSSRASPGCGWITRPSTRSADRLRASAVLVELFLADWVPRHLADDGEQLALVPAVVKEWLRFVGSRVPVPSSLVTAALAAVEQYAPVMRRRAEDPSAWDASFRDSASSPTTTARGHLAEPAELGVAPRPDCTGLADGSPSDSSTSPGTPGCWPARRSAPTTPGRRSRSPSDWPGRPRRHSPRLSRKPGRRRSPGCWPRTTTSSDAASSSARLGLAAELGVGAPTLRARVRRIRDVLS